MRRIFFDIETTGLGVCSGFKVMGWVPDASPNLVSPVVVEGAQCCALLVKEWLEEGSEIIGHNIMGFDLPLLVRHAPESGLREAIAANKERVVDTLIISRKLFPMRFKHSMDSYASELADKYGTKKKIEVEDFATADDPLLVERVARDVEIQKDLYRYMCDNGWPLAVENYHLDTEFLPAAIDLYVTGIPFDAKTADRERKRLHARAMGRRILWEMEMGGVSMRSNKQIHEALIGRHGKGLELTEKGNPQLNKKNFRRMMKKFPELRHIREFKKSDDLLKFVDTESKSCSLNFMHYSPFLGTKAVYPDLNLYGTRTNRASYSDPPLNQFPKSMREIISAPEGWRMVGFDIVALEMAVVGKVFYSVLGDDTIKRQVESGMSVKKLTLEAFAEALENYEYHRGQSPEDKAKTINYALLYGMAPSTLAEDLGVDEGLVRECIERRFPGMGTLNEVLREAVKGDGEDGTLQSLYGSTVTTLKRNAFNTLCQTSGSEYAKRVLTYIHSEVKGWGGHAIIWNHDEMQFLVPDSVEELEGKVKGVEDGVKNHIEDLEDDVGFITGVEGRIGRHWGETH